MGTQAHFALTPHDELIELTRKAALGCGLDLDLLAGDVRTTSPINGAPLLALTYDSRTEVERKVEAAQRAFLEFREVPAPVRGDLVSELGRLLRAHKSDLATLVSVETGKVMSEAAGEVQEMIDICDFAVGLSRQLYGRTMPSERPGHRLMETWHPLGVVGVISAFNFPVAVWSWNTAIALVCGDPVVWKPSEKASLSALAANALLQKAISELGMNPNIAQIVLGGAEVGEVLVDHPKVALVAATGSTAMGRVIGPRVAARFGRSLLELGGNNAAVVTASADIDIVVPGIVFAAAGTAGQRCTTMRRAIIHESRFDEVSQKLIAAYETLPIGDPLSEGVLVGPLIGEESYAAFQAAIAAAEEAGGELLVGGKRRAHPDFPNAFYVEPTIIRMPAQAEVVEQETFAPILYLMSYTEFEDAVAMNNDVPQGLSSSVFTEDQAEAERFMSQSGSDCGIVNVNIGTSGAEIGGAFGGEKETGGGRQSGSDAWRAYMRRATNTINYSGELPLAQGVHFDI